MRKQFDGLVGLVCSAVGEDPLSGTIYVFFNPRRDILKAVSWDWTGFCLLAEKLEHGRFLLQGRGARNLGILQSLIATCRLQGIDPYVYLVDVLQRVNSHPMRRVDDSGQASLT